MDEDHIVGGRHDRSAKGGAWRGAFLNRPRNSDEDADSIEPRDAGSRARSGSRPRGGARQVRSPGGANSESALEGFNQQAVLDQDRALIEQLTQRQSRHERPPVRKPPPPPKVTPYRKNGVGTSPTSSQPPTPGPTSPMAPVSPQRVLESATPQRQLDLTDLPQCSDEPGPTETGILAAALASCREPEAFGNLSGDMAGAPACLMPERLGGSLSSDMATTVPWNSAAHGSGGPELANAVCSSSAPAMKPVVPRTGGLFTASDIDSIMDSFGPSVPSSAEKPVESSTFNLTMTFGRDIVSQNFHDVTDDFYKSHGMDVPSQTSEAEQAREIVDVPISAPKHCEDFKVPERRDLRDKINSIDSWLEDDFTTRERMNEGGAISSSGLVAGCPGAPLLPVAPSSGLAVDPACSSAQGDIFQKLEEAKRLKALGQRMSPVTLKNIALQARPFFPQMPLEQLVLALRLFSSARCEDHDLYLRILGEIPVQIRGITPSMLISCVRVLWRLRLHEETYMELFSMEAMNMIRAKRRPTPRAPRRAPAPRCADAAASGAALTPTPPPPQDTPAPFNAEQLVHLGNALSRLGAKHPVRFMEIYQEQLALAIPRMTQQECELVCPTLAMSQLMHDPLRRAFLERCAQVNAGEPLSASGESGGGVAPDIAQYHQDADHRRRREKNFRNIYIIEASVRKETFSFFSSLPAEVRVHLDRLHVDAALLTHEGASVFSAQVANVLDQLGLSCDTQRMAGPLGLHVVAKSTAEEIVYECSDESFFYRLRQDDRNAVPELTALAKLRQRLLQRLGVQLTFIGVWEWRQMSEAHRINAMVKLQSFQ